MDEHPGIVAVVMVASAISIMSSAVKSIARIRSIAQHKALLEHHDLKQGLIMLDIEMLRLHGTLK